VTAWSSVLGRRDPVVKFALTLVVSLALVLVIDPVTPLLFLVTTLLAAALLGHVGLGAYARALGVLAIVGLGFVWSNAVLATVATDTPPLAVWGPIRVTEAGLRFGIAIALRGLAIGALSLTFVFTTDPTRFAVSLVRNARLSPRIAYPLLAAYRFLPFLTDEYAQIHLAQRVRGGAQARGGEALRARARELVPLFATAIRRATRIAVAMDARGFAGATARTYYRETPIGTADVVFAVATIALTLGLLFLSASAGWLRIWDGRFSA
jgi:energy-coupling factor transport system permease protein